MRYALRYQRENNQDERMMRLICAIFVLSLILPASARANTDVVDVDIDRIPVCYDFGCRTRQTIGISPREWSQVRNWFRPLATDADTERKQIQQAVGWLEVVAGYYTPIFRDKGQNETDSRSPGQMDCIDESTNATTYLRLLERHGLLRFHRVVDRAYRRTMWDQHWAAQIEEIASGERWTVDSWFQDYGNLPYLQRTQEWKDIPFFFTSFIDNSID